MFCGTESEYRSASQSSTSSINQSAFHPQALQLLKYMFTEFTFHRIEVEISLEGLATTTTSTSLEKIKIVNGWSKHTIGKGAFLGQGWSKCVFIVSPPNSVETM